MLNMTWFRINLDYVEGEFKHLSLHHQTCSKAIQFCIGTKAPVSAAINFLLSLLLKEGTAMKRL